MIVPYNPSEADRTTVEQVIVYWRDMRAQRLAQEKVAAKLKQQEEEAKSFVLECFKQQRFEGMLIDGRTTGLSVKTLPTVSDKEALIKYIKETGELDLLQFRLSTGAVDARADNGVKVPGTEYVEVYDLFDRKV